MGLKMKAAVHILTSMSFVACVMCSSFFFGERTPEAKLVHREKVVFYAIPWNKRTEHYSYNDTSQRPIKAIDCHDYQRTEATVNVTEGGIGYPYFTIELQSQRSFGLEYAIEIYA